VACGSSCHLFQLRGENRQHHLLSPVGFDWLFLFALQDRQLLAQDKDFQIFLLFG
jgi:hypothetical protein